MDKLRTEDARFENLPGYPFSPHYVEVDDGDGGTVRMHYVDEGEGDLVLCLHGQPSWSYLYRKMIPILVAGGCRVIAPDLVGFGKSDKPASRADYTYARHVHWLTGFATTLDLTNITMICQDWGGLLGLRVAAENPERFARIVASNTLLPDANQVPDEKAAAISAKMAAHYATVPVAPNALAMGLAMRDDDTGMGFHHWVKFAAESEGFSPGELLALNCRGALSAEEQAAYDAPFPSEDYMAGARQFPTLVPIRPDNPAISANRAAWKVLEQWEKPFVTAFSDQDPVTAGHDKRMRETIPGAQGQAHVTLEGGGHFLQEQVPEGLSQAALDLIKAHPLR
ncbi:MAG: haloalkane dehalogenase [Pseudomonadota bacterium]